RLDALTDAVRERIERRQRMREYAAAAATLRAALTAAGIDPLQNSGLREFGYAERVAAEWPDTPELQRSDAAFTPQDPKLAARQSLAAKVAERLGRFPGHPPPARPTSVSPVDWYAWSLAAARQIQLRRIGNAGSDRRHAGERSRPRGVQGERPRQTDPGDRQGRRRRDAARLVCRDRAGLAGPRHPSLARGQPAQPCRGP